MSPSLTDPNTSHSSFLSQQGIPHPIRPCFNWLPQYRYGLHVNRALQQVCWPHVDVDRDEFEFLNRETAERSVPISTVRPVLLDSVLEFEDWCGYVANQSSSDLLTCSNGMSFYPIDRDMGVIVAKSPDATDLLNNVLSYMTPAPQALASTMAVAGGYGTLDKSYLLEAHFERRAAANKLIGSLSAKYEIDDERIKLHSAGVGGLISATTRFMKSKFGKFTSSVVVPEYWDLLRCLLTYSPEGLSVTKGRDKSDFPLDTFTGTFNNNLNFVYLTFTNNPLGTTIDLGILYKVLESVGDETLFFLDCTSVDVEERANYKSINKILADFSHKNLMVTKSFSKEYNLAHYRLGYALFTRESTAAEIWPFFAAYPPASICNQALRCLKLGNKPVIDEYRRLNSLLEELNANSDVITFSGNCSNYTAVHFSNQKECEEMIAQIENCHGHEIYPGELPMQGGGEIGLGKGEVNLDKMKRIPFLSQNSLRLLVTYEAIDSFSKILAEMNS